MKTTPNALTADLLGQTDADWRAANYLSDKQIFLYDHPLRKGVAETLA